jgi:hypothetical protein
VRAITLTQPWATLVAIGAKRIETRDWQTYCRDDIAIHAAKGFPDDARYLVTEEPFRTALGGVLATELPRASIIAVVRLSQIFTFGADTAQQVRARSAAGRLPPFEADFGDYGVGRFGFVLENVRKLSTPVPARGMLNLWQVPSDVERAVREQLDGVAA